jgi:hypothetical protein
VPRRPASLKVELPTSIADEIVATAAAVGRSVAFVVDRALTAAPAAAPVADAGPRRVLAITTDEDDSPRVLTRARAAAPETITAAWTATRERFAAWVARAQEAARAEAADDLDAGLRDAADPATPPDRLLALTANEYPRVRALVARNPAAPPEALARLRADRDRGVQAALVERAPLGA